CMVTQSMAQSLQHPGLPVSGMDRRVSTLHIVEVRGPPFLKHAPQSPSGFPPRAEPGEMVELIQNLFRAPAVLGAIQRAPGPMDTHRVLRLRVQRDQVAIEEFVPGTVSKISQDEHAVHLRAQLADGALELLDRLSGQLPRDRALARHLRKRALI